MKINLGGYIMKFKYSLIILSIFLISLVFIASASAADVNKTTEVLSIDESTNIENNNTLTLDSSSKISAVSNDNNKENLQVPNSDTWYVNATSNPGGDGKSKDTAFTSLKEAIDSATDGDTVYIASGTYTGENNTNLTFSKNLNFIKYGDDEVTFNAQGLSRIWNVSATSINISGLTFRNGKSENGSAIYFAKI